MDAFSCFSEASGLKANQTKSSIYFGGVPLLVQEDILEKFGFSKGAFPFKYWGVPLDSKKLSIMQCQIYLAGFWSLTPFMLLTLFDFFLLCFPLISLEIFISLQKLE